jgi:hypothetical protein
MRIGEAGPRGEPGDGGRIIGGTGSGSVQLASGGGLIGVSRMGAANGDSGSLSPLAPKGYSNSPKGDKAGGAAAGIMGESGGGRGSGEERRRGSEIRCAITCSDCPQRNRTLIPPYLVASAEVTRLAPPTGTRAAPREVGIEVVPQAQTGLALQAWGVKVVPHLGKTRTAP